MNKILLTLSVVLIGILTPSCKDLESDKDLSLMESRSSELISFEQANEMIADIQDNNKYVDVNFGLIPVFNLNKPTEEMVKVRVALYRIYTHTSVIDNKYVITATPMELNISNTTYDYFKSNLHDYSNADIERKLSEGANIEDIMSYKPKFDNPNDFINLLSY